MGTMNRGREPGTKNGVVPTRPGQPSRPNQAQLTSVSPSSTDGAHVPTTYDLRPATVVCIIDDLGRGGAQRQLVELARAIDRQRFELRVVALSDQKTIYLETLRALGVMVELVPHRGTFSFATLVRLRRLLRCWRPALVQTWLFTADFYGRIAARLAGVPSVVSTVRSPEPDKPRHYVWVDRWLARITDLVVANSACAVEMFRQRERIPARKLRVVYNGIDLTTFDPARVNGSGRGALGVMSSARVIGSVGRLEPVKRYGDLVGAFCRVGSTYPGTVLVLVGEGSQRAQLEEQARQGGVADRVRLTGAAPAERMAELVAAMDIVVLPSEYEGCSNTILEAMAMGKPVIATDVGGNRELLATSNSVHSPQSIVHSSTQDGLAVDRGPSTVDALRTSYEVVDCGILVQKGDVDGLAAAILALLGDRDKAVALGDRGRARVERDFTTARMVREMTAVYDELLDVEKRA